MKKMNFIIKLSAIVVLTCGVMFYAGAFSAVRAANPTSGTLAPTATAAATWAGTGVGGTTNGESSCVEGTNCDSFTLTISGNPSDWAGKSAHIEINWQAVATDYDLYVHKDSINGTLVASSATGTSTTEAVDIKPSDSGTGVYVVHVLYFAATAADQYSGAASVKSSAAITAAVQSGETTPRFQNFFPQQSILSASKGIDAGEPSLGVNWKTGKFFFLSDLTTFRVNFDDSCPTTPASTWEDKSPMTSADSLDPIMFTDHGYNYTTPDAGRTIVSQLSGTTSLSSFTDNDGDTWMPNTGGGLTSGVDHQTVGAGGPFHAPAPSAVYPHPVYYCSQDIGDATCAMSVDGGQTYAPAVPIYTVNDCGGLHGHVKVGPDGSAYVPNKGCGGGQAVVVSENNGVNWAVRKVPNSVSSAVDPAVAIGRGDKVKTGRVYFGYSNANTQAVVAVSDDNGRSWKNFSDVGASFGIKNAVFPAMLAGDDDRAAFVFLGTPTAGNSQDRAFPGVWHVYAATTYDGGLTWKTSDVTPNDPVQRGGIWNGGGSPAHRNLLDFIGTDIDKQGRVVIGYADGCTGANCVQGTNTSTGNSYTALSAIARQTGGKSLFAANDASALLLTVPGAPTVTVGRNGTTARVTLSESDNGGSPVTSYQILRGTASGAETPLTTIAGSQLSYTDTVNASIVYYYRVVAVNAQGQSCGTNEVVSKPIGSTATGETLVTDPIGDQKGTQGNANGDLDIQSISMAETFPNNLPKLVFKLKISNPALQPNHQWRIIWNYPVKAADIADNLFTGTYYVGMNTDANSAPSFQYGTVTTVETVPANTSTPNMIGAADPSSSFDPATGTISIVLDPVKIGSPTTGDILGKLTARTFAGNGDQTVLSTAAIDSTGVGGTVDPYTAATYLLMGNIAPPTAANVTIGGRVTTVAGRGIGSVTITLTDSNGNARTARTNPFGYYRFAEVAAGQTYVLTARGKQYSFSRATRTLNVNEDANNINFVANAASTLEPIRGVRSDDN